MPKKGNKDSEQHSLRNLVLSGVIIAVVTGIFGLIGILINSFVEFRKANIPIEATSTAEAKLTALASFVTPTTTSTHDPASTFTIYTATPVLSTPTKASSPLPLTVGQDIKQKNCVSEQLWTPYTTSKNRYQDLSVKDGCHQLLGLGISPEKGKLLFSQQDSTEDMVNGLVGNISQTTIVEIEVDVEKLSNAEIKIGILSAKAPSNFLNGKLLVVYESGTIAIRDITNGNENIVKPLYVYTASCSPGIYNFRFELTNLRLNISRYSGTCKDGSPMSSKSYEYVDIPFENRYLFVGYGINQKGVIAANLVIEQK